MTSRKRVPILLMVQELGIGGTERQTTATALALDHSFFEPHIGAFRARGFRVDELREAGIPVFEIPVTSLIGPSVIRGALQLGRYLRLHRIQLVHTFDTPANLFAPLVARFLRVPVVLSSQRSYRQLNPPARRLLRLTDRIVDGVVVNCQAVARHMVDEEGNPPSRNHLCHNGIDTSIFHVGESERPAVLGPSGLTIGVVCGLRPEKDLETLLRAFAALRRQWQDARLAIVGSGSTLAGLQSLSRDLHIAAACHFEPAVRDVVPWIRALDIFVLPSRSEALSNSLMEAMACGCCSIASDAGGNPELVTPMRTGLLFKSGDHEDLAAKLELLASNPALRRSLAAEAAARIAREFSLEEAGRRMGEIYRSFLDRRSGASI
jgi:glycosyltransferase involved in cell wall biosynthesis